MSKNIKDMYFSRNVGVYPDSYEINGVKYVKKENLRYGTNPHQTACLYTPEKGSGILGHYKILKEGKSGLSQTNIEDINYAAGIIKYFNKPACAVMKHLNPSGVALQRKNDTLKNVYARARDCDSQAAFGSSVVFNGEVDKDTAEEIMQSIVENVAAPAFSPEAVEIFNSFEKYKRNKEIRVIQTGDFSQLPRYVGDDYAFEIKALQDGSMIFAAPFLTAIKNAQDLVLPVSEHKDKGEVKLVVCQNPAITDDLLFAWYVCAGVRSNAVVIAKDGVTLAVGTGEQDRVGAVSQAIEKAKRKFKGNETLEGASIASDGFFPFRDSIDLIAKEGIKGVIQPGGSVRDWEVIEACNEHGILMYFTGERCFAHH